MSTPAYNKFRVETTPIISPRWFTLKQAAAYSGLTARTISNYIAAGHVRSTNVVQPGSTRGRRLVDRLDLDAFLEAGVNRPPSEIVMNTRHKEVSL